MADSIYKNPILAYFATTKMTPGIGLQGPLQPVQAQEIPKVYNQILDSKIDVRYAIPEANKLTPKFSTIEVGEIMQPEFKAPDTDIAVPRSNVEVRIGGDNYYAIDKLLQPTKFADLYLEKQKNSEWEFINSPIIQSLKQSYDDSNSTNNQLLNKEAGLLHTKVNGELTPVVTQDKNGNWKGLKYETDLVPASLDDVKNYIQYNQAKGKDIQANVNLYQSYNKEFDGAFQTFSDLKGDKELKTLTSIPIFGQLQDGRKFESNDFFKKLVFQDQEIQTTLPEEVKLNAFGRKQSDNLAVETGASALEIAARGLDLAKAGLTAGIGEIYNFGKNVELAIEYKDITPLLDGRNSSGRAFDTNTSMYDSLEYTRKDFALKMERLGTPFATIVGLQQPENIKTENKISSFETYFGGQGFSGTKYNKDIDYGKLMNKSAGITGEIDPMVGLISNVAEFGLTGGGKLIAEGVKGGANLGIKGVQQALKTPQVLSNVKNIIPQAFAKTFGLVADVVSEKDKLGLLTRAGISVAQKTGTLAWNTLKNTDEIANASIKIANTAKTGLQANLAGTQLTDIDRNLTQLNVPLAGTYTQAATFVYDALAQTFGATGDTIMRISQADNPASKAAFMVGASLSQGMSAKIFQDMADGKQPEINYNGFMRKNANGQVDTTDTFGAYWDSAYMTASPIILALAGGKLLQGVDKVAPKAGQMPLVQTAKTATTIGISGIYDALGWQQAEQANLQDNFDKVKYAFTYGYLDKMGDKVGNFLGDKFADVGFKSSMKSNLEKLVGDKTINTLYRENVQKALQGGVDPSFDLLIGANENSFKIAERFKNTMGNIHAKKAFIIDVGSSMIGEGIAESMQTSMELVGDNTKTGYSNGSSMVATAAYQGGIVGALAGGLIKSIYNVGAIGFNFEKQIGEVVNKEITRHNIETAQRAADETVNAIVKGNDKIKIISSNIVGTISNELNLVKNTASNAYTNLINRVKEQPNIHVSKSVSEYTTGGNDVAQGMSITIPIPGKIKNETDVLHTFAISGTQTELTQITTSEGKKVLGYNDGNGQIHIVKPNLPLTLLEINQGKQKSNLPITGRLMQPTGETMQISSSFVLDKVILIPDRDKGVKVITQKEVEQATLQDKIDTQSNSNETNTQDNVISQGVQQAQTIDQASTVANINQTTTPSSKQNTRKEVKRKQKLSANKAKVTLQYQELIRNAEQIIANATDQDWTDKVNLSITEVVTAIEGYVGTLNYIDNQIPAIKTKQKILKPKRLLIDKALKNVGHTNSIKYLDELEQEIASIDQTYQDLGQGEIINKVIEEEKALKQIAQENIDLQNQIVKWSALLDKEQKARYDNFIKDKKQYSWSYPTGDNIFNKQDNINNPKNLLSKNLTYDNNNSTQPSPTSASTTQETTGTTTSQTTETTASPTDTNSQSIQDYIQRGYQGITSQIEVTTPTEFVKSLQDKLSNIDNSLSEPTVKDDEFITAIADLVLMLRVNNLEDPNLVSRINQIIKQKGETQLDETNTFIHDLVREGKLISKPVKETIKTIDTSTQQYDTLDIPINQPNNKNRPFILPSLALLSIPTTVSGLVNKAGNAATMTFGPDLSVFANPQIASIVATNPIITTLIAPIAMINLIRPFTVSAVDILRRDVYIPNRGIRGGFNNISISSNIRAGDLIGQFEKRFEEIIINSARGIDKGVTGKALRALKLRLRDSWWQDIGELVSFQGVDKDGKALKTFGETWNEDYEKLTTVYDFSTVTYNEDKEEKNKALNILFTQSLEKAGYVRINTGKGFIIVDSKGGKTQIARSIFTADQPSDNFVIAPTLTKDITIEEGWNNKINQLKESKDNLTLEAFAKIFDDISLVKFAVPKNGDYKKTDLKTVIFGKLDAGKYSEVQRNAAREIRELLNQIGLELEKRRLIIGNSNTFTPFSYKYYNKPDTLEDPNNNVNVFGGYNTSTTEELFNRENGEVDLNIIRSVSNTLKKNQKRVENFLYLGYLKEMKLVQSQVEYNRASREYNELKNQITSLDKTDARIEQINVRLNELSKDWGFNNTSGKPNKYNTFNSVMSVDGVAYYVPANLQNQLYLSSRLPYKVSDRGLLDAKLKFGEKVTDSVIAMADIAVVASRKLTNNSYFALLDRALRAMRGGQTSSAKNALSENPVQAIMGNLMGRLHYAISAVLTGDGIKAAQLLLSSSFEKQYPRIVELIHASEDLKNAGMLSEVIADNKQKVLPKGGIITNTINDVMSSTPAQALKAPIELAGLIEVAITRSLLTKLTLGNIIDLGNQEGLTLDEINQLPDDKLIDFVSRAKGKTEVEGIIQSNNKNKSELLYKLNQTIFGGIFFPFKNWIFQQVNNQFQQLDSLVQAIGIQTVNEGDRKNGVQTTRIAPKRAVKASVGLAMFLFQAMLLGMLMDYILSLFGVKRPKLGNASGSNPAGEQNTRVTNPFSVWIDDQIIGVTDLTRLTPSINTLFGDMYKTVASTILNVDTEETRQALEATLQTFISIIPPIGGAIEQAKFPKSTERILGETLGNIFIPKYINDFFRLIGSETEKKVSKDGLEAFVQSVGGVDTYNFFTGGKAEDKLYDVVDPETGKTVEVRKRTSLQSKLFTLTPGFDRNINANYLDSNIQKTTTNKNIQLAKIEQQLADPSNTEQEIADLNVKKQKVLKIASDNNLVLDPESAPVPVPSQSKGTRKTEPKVETNTDAITTQSYNRDNTPGVATGQNAVPVISKRKRTKAVGISTSKKTASSRIGTLKVKRARVRKIRVRKPKRIRIKLT